MSVDSQGISSEINQGSLLHHGIFPRNLLYLDGGQIPDATTGAVVDTLSAYTELYGVIPAPSLSKLFVSTAQWVRWGHRTWFPST